MHIYNGYGQLALKAKITKNLFNNLLCHLAKEFWVELWKNARE
jgi:hypothetical protein